MADTNGADRLRRSDLDSYGFYRQRNFDFEAHEDFMSTYLPVLARRESRWKALVGGSNRVQRGAKVKRFCRKGIPLAYRPMAWMSLTKADARMENNPGLYQSLLKETPHHEVVQSITLDIPRTFPENVHFADGGDMVQSLYNVLHALALNNPSANYCQGMNFVAAMMLLVLKDEEKVFWLYDTLINRILPDYYSPEMNGLKAEQELLGEIVRWKCPEIHSHMEAMSVPWCVVGAKWFICLFADVMPVETVLRIWDCMFVEGPKILLRVALTIIKRNSSNILMCNTFNGVVDVLKKMMTDKQAIECHVFMNNIFKETGSFPNGRLIKMRAECLQRVV